MTGKRRKRVSWDGILDACREYNWPFITFSAEKLCALEGDFTASEFVKSHVGVDNVCERSALAGCESYGGGELILKKQARDGITLAVAKIWAAVG